MSSSPFLESVRTELRTRHYSLRTEKTYLYWVKHFILFNDKRHPTEMGNREIERFLNHLAVNRCVSAATQNQALCAIVFMYRHVLQQSIEGLEYGFAKRPRHLPTVRSPNEVSAILKKMQGKYQFITSLLYGCGFRSREVTVVEEERRREVVFYGMHR